MSIGAFAGGLASGFGQGLQMGQALNKIRKERELETIREQGISAAKSARQADIEGQVQSVYDPAKATDEWNNDPTGFKVGDRTYGSREEAMKAAESRVDPQIDYFLKHAIPSMAEAYIAGGEPEKAKALFDWIKEDKNAKRAESWAGGVRDFQQGNYYGVGNYLVDEYNTNLDDGVTATGFDVILKDPNQPLSPANFGGYQVRLRDEETGEETAQMIDHNQALSYLNVLSPKQLAEYEMSKANSRIKAEGERAKLQTQAEIKQAEQQRQHQLKLVEQEHQAKVNSRYPRANVGASMSEDRINAQALDYIMKDPQARYDFEKAAPEQQQQIFDKYRNAIVTGQFGGVQQPQQSQFALPPQGQQPQASPVQSNPASNGITVWGGQPSMRNVLGEFPPEVEDANKLFLK